MRVSNVACLFSIVTAIFVSLPADAEQAEVHLVPGVSVEDAATLAGREQYAVDIRLYDGERLVSETSIAILEGYPAVIDTRANRAEDIGGGRAGMFQHLNSMVVLEAGPERCWPELGDTREIVDAALEQSELVRVGLVNMWIYSPAADRYEVQVRSIKPGEGRVGGVEELLGEESGCLPSMEPIEPEALPINAAIGGGQWWQVGSY